ncbi:MAG TPA: hypothetical protein DEF42_05005 [Desulfosporosinus sp.]|nr:hypothetical protein [Desulfosporosinus sp.]
MIINHNMASLNTYRQLSSNNVNSAKSLEKLSSGLRINRAGDDAAGLAISEKMRGQIRGLDQAVRNAQDGISMIQTAEGALSETHSILQRMRELGVQSTNDTLTSDDRNEIQKEVNQLVDEIDRIGNNTEFNTKKLINGSVSQTRTSDNTTLADGALLVKDTTSATKSGVYAVDVTTEATQGTVTASAAFDNANGLDSGDSITINNVQIDFAAADTVQQALLKINNQTDSTGVEAYIGDNGGVNLRTTAYGSSAEITVTYGGNAQTNLGHAAAVNAAGTDVGGTINGTAAIGNGKVLTLSSAGNAADGLSVEVAGTATAATMTSSADYVAATDDTSVLTINGVAVIESGDAVTGKTGAQIADMINLKSDQTGVTATFSANRFTLTSAATGDGANITIDTATAAATQVWGFTTADTTVGDANGTAGTDNITGALGASGNDANVTINNANTLSMHIGANNAQTMNVDINDMRTSAIGKNVTNTSNLTNIADIKTNNAMMSRNSAEDSLKVLDEAIKNVSAERSKLGSFQNRLEHTIANLGTSSENLTAAESRVRDVDMAKEMMNFQKNNILSQAAQAMLAQANQAPQGVLQLLR